MSAHEVDEPMDCSEQQPSASEDNSNVRVTLSVKWSEEFKPQKAKAELEKVLQTWANSLNKKDCKVLNVSEDGRAVIEIRPAPAVNELQDLNGKTLFSKDGKKVTIAIVSLLPQETQIPADASVNLPPFVSLQHEQMQLDKQSHLSSSAAVSTASEVNCVVPVSHYWYINQLYKEKIKAIEKTNGITINAEVHVFFKGGQESQQKALSEFTDLVQSCIGESNGSVIPLKRLDAEELQDTLKIIERPENKLLLALSSEGMTIYGPGQSQDAISRSLKGTQKASTNGRNFVEESRWSSQTTSDIGMTVKGALANTRLTIEAGGWRLMTTSSSKDLAKIEAKFGVHFKESAISRDDVEVKAVHKRGNASMESHAVRALLHLYQKIVMSPINFTNDAMKDLNNTHTSVGASSGPVMNSQSEYSMFKTEVSAEEGAAAGDKNDEDCPICFEKIKTKKRLTCNHVFCEDCLASTIQSMGPICPVCKDVFGILRGNQPKGEMSSHSQSVSLPGFEGFGTIVIKYFIPSGIQTEEHPNPGQRYASVERSAYLPNNREGKEVLRLLKKAFAQRLIFTVGTSITTGKENQVTWNDIHHKTSPVGGPESFGYPDPHYLSRVKEELKAKGIK